MNNLALIQSEPSVAEPALPPADSILPLRLENVCFSAGGKLLIDHISLQFEHGSCTAVLGPNGAGKSLLLRLCHGLLKPTAGRIRWQAAQSRILRRRQAMVFQRPVLLRRSVAANVNFALAAHGVSRNKRPSLVLRALEQVGLAHLARRPARVLSGGEQQRLALARAWALQPQVLFLDEPTANLDPAATRLIENIVAAIRQSGVKIILTTHDLGQARRHAGEVIFLHHGLLLEHTPATRFFTRPQSAEAQAFLAGELLD